MIAAGFSWFKLWPAIDRDELLLGLGIDSHTQVYFHAWLACGAVLLFAALARMGLERARKRTGVERYYADETLTFRTMGELVVAGVRGFMADLLDPADVKRFFPLVGGLFLYIFACNIQGILPGFLPPTDYFNTSFGMAVIVFLTFMGVGLARDPVGFIKHMTGPMWWLAPLMFFIECVSLLARPYALTLRLTGNMFGDHTVFGIMSGLVPVLLPAILILLAIIVMVIQAFVFSLLTTIYIALAVPHHEHDEAH